MTGEDNGALLSAADDIRAYERDKSASDIATLSGQVAAALAATEAAERDLEALQGRYETLQAKYDAYVAAHPDAAPTPAPSTRPPLIGSSSRVEDWDARRAMLEATGGKLQARRLFFQSLTDNPTTRLAECKAQGHVPVISYKPGSFTWAQIATGAADAALNTLFGHLATWGLPAFVTISHEPGKQSLPKNQGEAGTAADFGRMMAKVAGVAHAKAPQVKVGPILNGWMFSAQTRGFSDAELDAWLPKATRDLIDFLGADDYNAKTGEKAVTRIKRRVEWAKRVGFTKPQLVGETNAWVATDLVDTFGYVKSEPSFRDGAVLLWNSTVPNPGPDDFRPVHETGLLDDFQAILKAWPV